MATKIGSVVIDIEAKMTKLEADLAKANRTLSRFDKDARGIGGRIEGAFRKVDGAMSVATKTLAGFAAGIGVGLLQGGAKAILDFADNLATAADQANIGITRFQTLKGAFRSLEVDAAVFEKVLQKLITAQGDVASGAENTATKALDKLGISAKILSGEITTTDQLIDALAKSLGDIDSPAKRASIAADIVSAKFGTQLAAALGDGGKALHQAETDFISTGKVIDREMVQKLADANEKWDSFVEAVQSKSVILAADVLTAFESIGSAAAHLWDKYLAAQASFVLAHPQFYDEKTERGAQDVLIKQHREMLERIEADRKRTAARLASVNLAGLEWIGGGGRTKLKPNPDPDPKQVRSTAPTTPTFSPHELRMGNDLPPVDLPVSLDLEKSLVPTPVMQDNAEFWRSMNASIGEASARVSALDISLADTFDTELFERVQQIGDAFEQDIARSLADIIVYGDNLGDSMEQAFKRMASAMLEAVIQAKVLGPLLESMGASGGGDLFGKLFKGAASNLVPWDDAWGKKDPWINTFGGGRALGGPVAGGTSYLVGERGAEKFTPLADGYITPANDIGGVNPISITINAPGATAETVSMIRREIAAAAPALVNAATQNTMNRANRRQLPRGLG